MLAQFGQAFTAGEGEILDDRIALRHCALVGCSGDVDRRHRLHRRALCQHRGSEEGEEQQDFHGPTLADGDITSTMTGKMVEPGAARC
jgi:hypothetical protein